MGLKMFPFMNIFERHINDEVLGKDQIQKTLERVQTSDPQWIEDDLIKLRAVINKLNGLTKEQALDSLRASLGYGQDDDAILPNPYNLAATALKRLKELDEKQMLGINRMPKTITEENNQYWKKGI
tara:strand:+ start:378 stop:755 length:378 start_codon:yes stop_codon:yes gene_type:complete